MVFHQCNNDPGSLRRGASLSERGTVAASLRSRSMESLHVQPPVLSLLAQFSPMTIALEGKTVAFAVSSRRIDAAVRLKKTIFNFVLVTILLE